jgi:hypothetical protein
VAGVVRACRPARTAARLDAYEGDTLTSRRSRAPDRLLFGSEFRFERFGLCHRERH